MEQDWKVLGDWDWKNELSSPMWATEWILGKSEQLSELCLKKRRREDGAIAQWTRALAALIGDLGFVASACTAQIWCGGTHL